MITSIKNHFSFARIIALNRFLLDFRLIFLFIVVIYSVAYFANSSAPGNVPYEHPLGWWGWFDQGHYLLSANALAHFDLTPDKHFYPPLYPAIGAIFLKWSSGHPYFAINLAALLWFSYVFVRVSDRYIRRWGSIVLLFGTTIFNYTLFENYVIPWTTTLSVALLASGILGLVWLQEIQYKIRTRISDLQVFFVATCLGLIVPTRPVDAAVGCVIGLGLLISYWQTRRRNNDVAPNALRFLLLVIMGSIIGPLLFLGFNIAVFHSIAGGYLQTNASHGFFFGDLAEKFVSIWLDGFTLYGEPNAGLTEHYPWLLISLAGLAWVLIQGDGLLRTVALAIVLVFVLYLPYGDLLPNGLWRYKNIHYFKWIFPYMALFAVLLVRQALLSWRRRDSWVLPFSLLFGIPLLMLSLQLVVTVIPVSPHTTNNQTDISFELPNKQIDFIDIKGLYGEFTDIYFGSHHLLLDGRELMMVKDFRLLPMSFGVRLLFIRPVEGKTAVFYPDQNLIRQAGHLISAQLGNYHFTLGAFKQFRKLSEYEIISEYHLGDTINFSQQGDGYLYATQGWSDPEARGRWSTNSMAAIQLHLVGDTSQALELELVMNTLINGSHPCQEIDILVNEIKIAQPSLCIGKGGEQTASYKFAFARELLRAGRRVDIRLVTPNSISPKILGINADERVLGVWIQSLKITAANAGS